jgi:hypothetical protein
MLALSRKPPLPACDNSGLHMGGRERTMRGVATTTAIGFAALVAACAPDAWKPAPGYEGFLNQVQNACYYQRIGLVNVGDMLTNPGSSQAGYFIDETSRLYFGKITPDNWTSAVTAFMQGRTDDPGVRCVLEQLRQNKAAQGLTAPPPVR